MLCPVEGVVLAGLLAEHLQEVVPPAYAVVSNRGLVVVGRQDGSGGDLAAADVGDIVDQPGDRLVQLMSACNCALKLVQDAVVEDTASSWPGAVPTSPRVAVKGRQIRLWYGGNGQPGPILELRPIVRS